MSLPNELLPVGLLATPAAGGGDESITIERSLRFNSGDSAYLSRSNSTLTNQRVMTFSWWMKVNDTSSSVDQIIFGQDYNTSGDPVVQRSLSLTIYQGQVGIYDYGASDAAGNTGSSVPWTPGYIDSTAVFRDPSAWYHFVIAVDTTQSTAADRCKVYVNGVQRTHSSYPVQNSYLSWGQVRNQYIGGHIVNGGYTRSLSAQLAEICFIDGLQLSASDFGAFDTNGVWQPIDVSGLTYGTGGFHLDFSDNSGTTSTTLGKDAAGSNNWTPNNFSVTAGAGNDSLRDSPTNGDTADDTGLGGELPGNYCTWNPLDSSGNAITISNGNLDTTNTTSTYDNLRGTFGMSSGKWYWEVEITSFTGGFHVGLSKPNANLTGSNFLGGVAGTWAYGDSGYKWAEGSFSAYGAGFASVGTKIGVAFDADAGTVVFYRNGSSEGTAFTGLTNGPYLPAMYARVGNTGGSWNFGQRAFAYQNPGTNRPSADFKALCTANLPTPTIAEGSTVMDVAPYIGNGTTLTISGLEFSPDLVWIKGRDFNSHHRLYDQIRLATNSLRSSSTDAEGVESTGLTAFTSDGFTLGSDPGHNNAGQAMVAWTWDAGSSTATNNSGSISSQVRANASAGFSIVTWSALSSAGSVGHGLNAVPSLLITKDRANYGWYVYHQSVGSGQYLLLNSTAAAASNSTVYSTSPTSTVFDPGTGFVTGGNWGNLVTYCFAPVAGYSAFGSFIGNGSSDGPFVYTGFRPRFLLYKCSSVGGDWWNFVDTARATYNVVGPYLESGTQAESTGSVIDVLSNGFKLRFGLGNQWNGAGQTYIYAAFAEHPFQTARAR